MKIIKETKPQQPANAGSSGPGKKSSLAIKLIAVAVIFVSLLYLLFLHKPARYNPLDIVYTGQVSKYLTHELLPQLYNGAQGTEPFDLVVTQKGINDVIARAKWPKRHSGIVFSAPEVLFLPDTIVLMGTAVLRSVQVVITIELNPLLDEHGLLNLRVSKVKAGAMNITPVIKAIAGGMYADRLTAVKVDPCDLGARIAASLFNDEPFDPVFEIKDVLDSEEKKVRVEKITLTPEKLTVRLVPVAD
ncbi:MAG: hypothetical protein MUO27_02900 [Sedimentisphaerales bacterium]|nr:hypothetical protein [Sedimentisphaerales bacterium]